MDEIKLHWNCLPKGNIEMNNRTLVSVQTKHKPILISSSKVHANGLMDGSWKGKRTSWMISKFVPVLGTHFVHTLRAKHMVGLTAWLVIAAQLGSCLAMPQSARRQLGRHYNHPKETFAVDGHICYKSGCEKYDEHLHHWVKDPHCCAYTNGYLGQEWARCSAGTFRSSLGHFAARTTCKRTSRLDPYTSN